MNKVVYGMDVKESDMPTPFDGKVRRFAVVDDVLHVVGSDDERPYVWCFSQRGKWSTDRTLVGAITDKGVLTWVGTDHREHYWLVGELAPHVDLLEVPPETAVWGGLDKNFEPTKKVTTVGELLAERTALATEVRLRPATLLLMENALGGREAVQKLVRRAIGTGAEERIVKIFQDECRPHDGEHVRGGPDSNELMRCRRCGAEWWD